MLFKDSHKQARTQATLNQYKSITLPFYAQLDQYLQQLNSFTFELIFLCTQSKAHLMLSSHRMLSGQLTGLASLQIINCFVLVQFLKLT